MTSAPDFALAAPIETSSAFVCDLALSHVRLSRDSRYAWLLLMPRKPGLVEITDLSRDDRLTLMDEIAAASAALRACVPCDKLNVAAIGNLVPQLHVHVVARRRDDFAWPQPVWGRGEAVPYPEGAAEALAVRIAAMLSAKA